MCSKHEDIYGRIKALQVEFTDMEIAKVTLCHLRSIAFSTMRTFGEEYSLHVVQEFALSTAIVNYGTVKE